MKEDYFIVHRELLPDYIDKVIYAGRLLNEGSVKTISEAVKKAGISRSTYYKYKDKIFASTMDHAQKCIFNFSLSHEKGKLSSVLGVIAQYSGNILTIHQNIPIHNVAHLTISLDISKMTMSVTTLLKAVSGLEGVTNVRLIAMD